MFLSGTQTWRLQLWLSGRLIPSTEETRIYISTFPNTLTSKMAKYHEVRICFFDKRVRSFMSRTAITLKFQMRWFPEKAGYSLEKKYTDINLPYLWSNEYKNIIGSLIFDLRKR